MATFYQFITYKRLRKAIQCWAPALKKNPQKRGSVRKLMITTPRKPNSAIRKICRVRLVTGRRIRAKIPGSTLPPQKYNVVLVRGKGLKDTPGINFTLIRGVYDFLALYTKTRRRSIYGVDNTEKLRVKRVLRKLGIMGSVSLLLIFSSIFIFSFILFFFSYLFSFFFSKSGRVFNYRDLYECGFKPISDNKTLIDIHFSVIGLIFLIYEMEIVLFVPIFLNMYNLNLFLLLISVFSLFVLGLSYIYEWERYGLDWFF